MDDWLETHFKSLFKLETNGSPKRRIVQALNNPIYFFNKHINYFFIVFPSNIYEYPKYHQQQ